MENNKIIAKILAHNARNKLDDLHEFIPDELMKQINIRMTQGIYEVLEVFFVFNKKNKLRKILMEYFLSVPDYWEDPSDEEIERINHGSTPEPVADKRLE